MTADPNDSKGPQQIPATDVGKLLAIHNEPETPMHAVVAGLLGGIAKIVEDAAGHRGKGRPAELSDIPPASLRHMASLMKVYARQLGSATGIVASPTAVTAAIEAEAQAVVDAAIGDAPLPAVVQPTPLTVAVMAEVGPFGPPGAYPDNVDDDASYDVPHGAAFGPPAPYVESNDDNPPEVETPKA